MLADLSWVVLVLILFIYSRRQGAWLTQPVPWWYILFFFSGFPALLYQIVWQRALFTLYGVNIESVTMVVTAFMLGLGLGSLLGGKISKRRHLPLLAIFGIIELSIALFGVISLRIFHWAAVFTAGVPPLQTGLITFGLVVVPTMLMGSTLPILVAHSVRVTGNVGTSVAALYAVNTLGSATACFCAGFFIMRWLGESGSISLAAAMNALVGLLVLGRYADTRKSGAGGQEAASVVSVGPNHTETSSGSSALLRFPLAMVIVGVAGFISLAYEIVWYRLFSFTTAGLAKSFAFLLGAYLVGIGIGSLISERICGKYSAPQMFLRFVTTFVFLANILGFLVAPLLAYTVQFMPYYWMLLPIGVAAAFLGAVFPLVCHLSVSADDRAGARMSYLYLSNIIGSALGSYTVGFILMDVLSMRQIAVALALVGIGLGIVMLVSAGLNLKKEYFLGALAGAAVLTALIPLSSPRLFDGIYEKLLMKALYFPSTRFAHVVENKSGVIAVTAEGTVFGGGIYDGRFNTGLIRDTNGIQRAYALSFLHPDPKEVLMIGLSSGSWAQVIANNPYVEHLTVVEINPGYLQLIAQYHEVSGILHNPKVKIVIDDGRRWMVRNPGRQFDMIVMNTTYHWRSHNTNLLSTDFLQAIRKHLKPGGVEFYNTTESEEVQATGVKVFPYGLRVANFLAVSDSPFQCDRNRWREVLTHYSIEGHPVFDLSREDHRARLEQVLTMPDTLDRIASDFYSLESENSIRKRTKQARIITDDNMGTEWQQ